MNASIFERRAVPCPTLDTMASSTTKQLRTEGEESLSDELSEVAREVVRLRSQLIKIEVLELVEQWLNRVVGSSAATALIGVGSLFMLVAAALAIGDALGHLGWGMLIVGGGVALAGGVFALVRPKLVDLGDKTAKVDTRMLEPSLEPSTDDSGSVGQLPP